MKRIWQAAVCVCVAAMGMGLMGQATQPGAATRPAMARGGRGPQMNPNLPTLWIIGDSTVNNNANGGLGWGAPFADYFDKTKVNVANRAIAGRSARSYVSEGQWDRLKAQLKKGDFVLMQFGHNDGPAPMPAAGNENSVFMQSTSKGRPDLPGLGDETTKGLASTGGKEEEVHTYGWYMTKFVKETKAAGATPIMLTMVPHNTWEGAKVRRPETKSFIVWNKEIAAKEGIALVDLNDITTKKYEVAGPDVVATYFTPDKTHTLPPGAKINAESVVEGLKGIQGCPLVDDLSDAGKALPVADAEDVVVSAATQPAK